LVGSASFLNRLFGVKEYQHSPDKLKRSVGTQAECKNEEPLKIVSTFYMDSGSPASRFINKPRNASLLFLAAGVLIYLVLYAKPVLHEVQLISNFKM
jgi:hypothetical protein